MKEKMLPYWMGPCLQASDEWILNRRVGETMEVAFETKTDCARSVTKVMSVINTNLVFVVIKLFNIYKCGGIYKMSRESVHSPSTHAECYRPLNAPIPCSVSRFNHIRPLLFLYLNIFHSINSILAVFFILI